MLEPLTRDGAREAAAHELSRGIYQSQRPGLVQQLIRWALDGLQLGLQKASGAFPGGAIGLVALLLLLVAAIVGIRLAAGPLARGSRLADRFDDLGTTVRPAEHRRRADRHAADGHYADAVRERLRAIVADLEQRTILEPRPARTAAEIAGEAGAALPDVAVDLRRAARTFDDVWYGGRSATPAMDADLRVIDSRVQASRPAATARLAPAVPAGPV